MNTGVDLAQGVQKFLAFTGMATYPSHIPSSTIERFRNGVIDFATEHNCSVTFLDPDPDALLIDTEGNSNTFHMENALIDYHNAHGDAEREKEVIATYLRWLVADNNVDQSIMARLTRLRMRIIDPAMLTSGLSPDTPFHFDHSCRPLAPGLGVVLCEDLPDQIKILQDEDLKDLGDIDDIFRMAAANTNEELEQTQPEIISITSENNPDGIYALGNGGYYLGTSVIIPNRLLQWIPDLKKHTGWFIAVPTREFVFLAPVTSGNRMVNQVGHLAEVAYQQFHGGSHPVSPFVYVTGGEIEGLEIVAGPVHEGEAISLAIRFPEQIEKLLEQED